MCSSSSGVSDTACLAQRVVGLFVQLKYFPAVWEKQQCLWYRPNEIHKKKCSWFFFCFKFLKKKTPHFKWKFKVLGIKLLYISIFISLIKYQELVNLQRKEVNSAHIYRGPQVHIYWWSCWESPEAVQTTSWEDKEQMWASCALSLFLLMKSILSHGTAPWWPYLVQITFQRLQS
jgi:hypothetical protein